MRPLMALLVCGLVGLAACGGSSTVEDSDGTTATSPQDTPTTGDSTSTPSSSSTTSDEGTGGEEPEVGEAGSFTVNDVEFAVTMLNRCIPFSDSPGNLDLQALAGGAKLNLQLLGSMTDVSVDGSLIEEEFGSIAFGDDQVVEASEVSGDRWTGSATAADSLGSGTVVEIAWDVMVPEEARDCGL